MKTSLKKLRGFTLHHNKHDRKDSKIQPLAQLDELAKASQDMQDMRDCYDSLLSAAAGAENSAYEFSESLREMGACLLQKIALNDDEEAGKVLLMLGKAQFELQRLVDSYRSHIFQTITVPSESLLNELRTVEEMKQQCDEKRELYDYMRTKRKEKGRTRIGKGDAFSSQQLQVARDDFDEEATLFVFRLKSLKQGQFRSLLTQASRHHHAQLIFFRKGLKTLETVEPHVKSVTEQQHIDYNFSGLEDDVTEDGEDGDENDADNGSDESSGDSEGREPSFDYRYNGRLQKMLSASRKSMDVDPDITFPKVARVDMENVDTSYDYIREMKKLSQSAPLLPPRKFDPAERIRQLHPSSTKKFHSYVLPTPGDAKSPNNATTPLTEDSVMQTSPGHTPKNLYHSVPLESPQNKRLAGSRIPALYPLSILNENDNRTPLSLIERISYSPKVPYNVSDSAKVKRFSFSGPLTSRPMSTIRSSYVKEPPQFSSGPMSWTTLPKSTSSPRVSPSASPTFMSSPKINELHELPRPPPIHLSSYHIPASPRFVGYSAPLMSSRSPPDNLTGSKFTVSKVAASPLPTPPAPPPPPPLHGLSSLPPGGRRSKSALRSRARSRSASEVSVEFEKAGDNGAGSHPLSPILF